MATENVKVVKIDTQPAQVSIKELKAQLKELKNTMLSCEEGTEEYYAALTQAADITHTLKEQTEEINASAMDFGQIASNTTKAIGGIVGGFQAATVAMNMFGIENEDVLKSMQKMQQLMALTQAFPAIDNGIKAFKRLGLAIQTATHTTSKFGKALIATGLGALIAALGYLIANFEDISKWLDEITGQTDFLGNLSDKVMGGLNAGWAAIVQTLKGVGNAIVTYVVAPFKSVWNAIQAYTSTNGGFADKLKAAGKAMKDEFVGEWKDVGNDFKKIGEIAADAYQEGLDKNKARRTAESQKEREERLKREKAAAEAEAKAIAEIRNKYAALSENIGLYGKNELEKNLHALKKAEDEALKTLKASLDKRIITIAQYEKDKKAIEDYYAGLRKKAEKDAEKAELDKRINSSIYLLDTSYQLEIARLKKQYDEKLISEEYFIARKKELHTTYIQDYIDNIQYILDTETELTDTQILDLTKKINAARESLNTEKETTVAKGISEAFKESADALNAFADNPAWGNILKNVGQIAAVFDDLNKNHIEKGSKEAINAYLQVASMGFAAIAQLMNGLASEQDTSNREGFESAKEYQIAGATMNMLGGIVSAWASSMFLPFPTNIVIGSLLSAMMLGTGIAQISKISSTQFGGATTPSISSTATPNASAIQSITAPVQYTQDIQGANIEGAIKDSKVYVTETDITNTQNKVHVSESEARF